MPDLDDLDRQLRSALSTYGDPGPDSGLDQRILSRIFGAHPTATNAVPRRRWLLWAVALPAAACALLFIALPGLKPAHRPSATSNQASSIQQSLPGVVRSEPSSTPPPAPARNSRTRASHITLATPPAPLPKLDVFPTPQPLTPQEWALVDLATHLSEPERRAIIEAQKSVDAPLDIAAIHIQPLESSAQSGN